MNLPTSSILTVSISVFVFLVYFTLKGVALPHSFIFSVSLVGIIRVINFWRYRRREIKSLQS